MAGTLKLMLLLKFKDDLTEDKKQQLIEGYAALPSKIDVMKTLNGWKFTDCTIYKGTWCSIYCNCFQGCEDFGIVIFGEIYLPE
ncbi:hypothetical protein R1sor_007816 [Riccia sorocarpa]|uniref:Uncharacterized protein n=1 Tax=Riccia sorocarpa TaxID=122646 RepID=A0ABD3HV61_9MARC